MSKTFFAASLALSALLAGCGATAPTAPQGMLTYETSPEGAQLFEGGQLIGVAPVTRTYQGDGKAPTIKTPEVTAVWPSGAKATFWTNIEIGSDRVATIERPAKAPNLQADLDNAAKVKLANQDGKKDDVRREQVKNSSRCQSAQQGTGRTTGVLDKADCF